MYDYDLLVIGAGSGGISGAKHAAKYGAKVAIVESQHLGGVCVNEGCINKKLMVYAADFADLNQEAANYGWRIDKGTFDWNQFKTRRDAEVERLRGVQARILAQSGVEIFRGQAIFVDAHKVEMGDRVLTADKILIAVGGKPLKPKLPGIEHTITSHEIFNLPEIPQRLAIIGSGYIGVEFASIFHNFGTEVTLMDRDEQILSGFDDDVCQSVRNGLEKRGIRSLRNTTAKCIEQTAAGLKLTLDGDRSETLIADVVLCAVGRTPNLEDLNLENAGIEVEGKAIAVDAYSRTSQANIYAVGDCTNRLALTPVARAEGQAFANTVFGNKPQTVDYRHVPSAVFARPEAASVGFTETEAREQYGDEQIQCCRVEFQSLYASLSQCPEASMLKLVSERSSQKVLGVHLVSAHAAEIVQGIALAVKHGITHHELNDMIGIHPTSAEEFFNAF